MNRLEIGLKSCGSTETETPDQISHLVPIVEQLAKLAGQPLEPEIASRINELKQEST